MTKRKKFYAIDPRIIAHRMKGGYLEGSNPSHRVSIFFGATTFSKTTVSMTTLSIYTLRIIPLSIKLKVNIFRQG